MISNVINGGLLVKAGEEMIRIEAWGNNSLRVRATKNSSFSERNQGLLPLQSSAEINVSQTEANIKNGRITAQIKEDNDLIQIVFFKDDKIALKEYVNPYAPAVRIFAREYKRISEDDYAIKVRFESNSNEKIFGMGQYQQSEFDMKGCVLELAPKNAQISIPFYISNIGYGFLWNNPAIGKVSFGKNYTEWDSNLSSEIDYWITVGDEPKELLKNYSEATGRAPEFPDDLLGLWQCKLRYRTQEEVLEVAREYHRRGLPLDMIVIDYYHWMHDGDWSFDPAYWPDPAAMVKELNDMGTRCMVSVWPTVQTNSVNYEEVLQKDFLVKTVDGKIDGIFGKPFYDATNPKAQEYIWKKCKENYYDYGIDSFWLDCAEPEFIPTDFERYMYSVGLAEKNAGIYPLEHTKGMYEGMKAADQDTVVNLVRSGWVGSQRYGALLWSGDIRSTFETLRVQLCAGLNIGMAGIPWWTTDTAGFIGNVTDPGYNELLIRWFQFSTFSPVLRLHGCLGPLGEIPTLSDDENSGGYAITAQPHELWSHGEEVYEILKKYLMLRVGMKDYLKQIMAEASENGSPLLRAMFYEFPDDKNCWELNDQYMFGDRYLVAPVMYEGMREREVYLPCGNWKDIHTGDVLEGGRRVTVPAPLEIIPVFERLM